MKFVVFGIALLVGVPVMAAAAIYSEKIKGWLLSLMIFTTALADRGNINFMSMEHYRGPDRGFEVTITELIAMALSIAILLRRTKHIKWLPYNTFFMLGFFALALLSARDVPLPILSWFTLFKLVRTWLLYWCVVNCIRTGIPMHAVWRGLMAVAALILVEALQQKYLGGIYRVSASFDHSNTLAMYLNMISALVLAFGIMDTEIKGLRMFVSIGAAVALLLTTVMTFSRAGMAFGLFTTVGTLAYAMVRMRSKRVTIVTALAAVGILMGGAMTGRSIIERFMEAPAASSGARHEFNKAARLMVEDHALGVGINQFSEVLTLEKKYRKHFKIMANEKHAGVCHHVYWLTAAEMGWLGLLAFVLVIVRFAWHALVYAIRTPGREGGYQAAILLGMLATGASGFYEWVLRITPLFFTFFICAGLSAGLAEREKLRRRKPATATTL